VPSFPLSRARPFSNSRFAWRYPSATGAASLLFFSRALTVPFLNIPSCRFLRLPFHSPLLTESFQRSVLSILFLSQNFLLHGVRGNSFPLISRCLGHLSSISCRRLLLKRCWARLLINQRPVYFPSAILTSRPPSLFSGVFAWRFFFLRIATVIFTFSSSTRKYFEPPLRPLVESYTAPPFRLASL